MEKKLKNLSDTMKAFNFFFLIVLRLSLNGILHLEVSASSRHFYFQALSTSTGTWHRG